MISAAGVQALALSIICAPWAAWVMADFLARLVRFSLHAFRKHL